MAENPKDLVKRYLDELIVNEYGAVFDGEPRPGEFDKPALGIEMKKDTYDRLGWAVCHAVVRGAFKKKSAGDNYNRAAETLRHVVETIREGVRRGRPIINGEGPPWYDVAVGDVRIRLEPDVATFEVEFDFSTGLVPEGVT